MLTIEVDEDIFRRLQGLAQPFIDTPNDVIRRLLDGAGTQALGVGGGPVSQPAPSPRSRRNGKPSRTYGEGITMREYRPYILRALLNEGGRAHLSKVKDYIRLRLGQRFDQHDLDYTQSNAVVWENRVEWQRLEMRQDGLIAPHSPKGIWELTEKGTEEARHLRPEEG